VPEPLPRGRNPFDETGVQRGADGVAHYLDRPPSLVAMLRASVERDAAATALVEVGGGPSITYEELWERSTRVAGGLRGAGVRRGDRVAIRLGNGIDWVLAFFGVQLLGAVVVPVNTRLAEEEVDAFTDGWLHTGDLARIDTDGLLYIVDRKKDMINRGGENVYCIEVENALAGAPGVGEAAVVPVPDEMMGEKVGAVIVPLSGQELDVTAVIEYSRAHLADFKVPQYIALREQPLPRNPGGKLLKKQLRAETQWGEPLR
jgi:acyl-CoA synthetase (AMP-forming)/AMP-acid ligase II